MSKVTPLHAVHVAAGARMVDFGGWDMPLHYGSQLEEHHAVRRLAGMFDVSHMLAVDLAGPDAKSYLLRLLANNVQKLKEPGKALYSCMLNASGGVIDDLIVYYFSPTQYRIVVNAGTADKDLAWMEAQREDQNAQITLTPRRDLAMIAAQGPDARERVWQARPAWRAASEALKPFFAALAPGDVMLARTGYTGEDGFEITVPSQDAAALWRDLAAAGAKPAGLGARDTLRLEAGMNLYGQDMDDTTNPFAAGLGWTIDLTAGRDFLGRGALLAEPPQEMLGLVLLDRGVLRGHQKVSTALGEGEITSGGFGPTLNQSIAFARLPRGVEPGATVTVTVRDKPLQARVVKLPFVRQGKILI
ncbi:aminomethyltransferase [Burkholderiales bacterium]|nr:MAG: glycine cleavage system aminomethyltransferase GcvT [Burkholderiales bacterium]CAG0971174.1 aminomethyltransferase [Burkholderiales bacterium]